MNYGGIFKCVGNLSFRTNIMYCIRRWFRILFYACFLPVSYVYRWLVHRYRSDLTTSYSNFVTIKKYCKTASLSSSPYRYFSFHTRLFPPFQFFRFILLIVLSNPSLIFLQRCTEEIAHRRRFETPTYQVLTNYEKNETKELKRRE